MKSSVAIAACLAVAGCGTSKSDSPPPSPSPTAGSDATKPAPPAAPAGLDLTAMKKDVRPGDDFYGYANGAWVDRTEIPADRSSWGNNAILSELTATRTAELIKAAAASAPAGSDARKVGDYFASFMAEDVIEGKGIAPLQPKLDAIAAITDAASLARALGGSIRADVDAFNATNFETTNVLGLWVAQDLDDPTRYAPFLLQGGLGLPDRDFYLEASPRMEEIRTKYEAHIAAVLTLAGIADPAAKAKRIFELERSIAKGHATRTESADIRKGNNHWKRADFAKRAPGLDWDGLFTAAALDQQTEFVVWHPTAVVSLAALVKRVPVETWKEYLTFHAIDAAAAFLPKAFVEEGFAFHGTTLNGVPKMRDRWKRAVTMTSIALGDAVGKLYVDKYFPASEKQRAAAMVKQVLAAFGTRIDQLTWMSPETKQKAKAKLAVLKVGVGYPDKWKDYSGLEVIAGDALGNADRAAMFEYKRSLAKLGGPVDRDEWVMVPHVVNAVNLPAMNAMNFPAGMLQPPFFDPNRPEVMDYGAIGAVIGHEISHSFDDQGAQFDATGKLHNWWTDDDLAQFKVSAAQLVRQYDAYKPFPDLAVNGTLTLSENLADVAGLTAAYDGYRLAYGGKEAPAAQGFTGDQQFFLSYAQSRLVKLREPAARARIMTDSHSPNEYRVATVRNIDVWYTTFAVEPTDKMYLAPADRVHAW
jgi:putative endopeptidase